MRGIAQSLPAAFVSPDGTSAARPALEEHPPCWKPGAISAGSELARRFVSWEMSCGEVKVGRRRFYVRVTSFAFELALTSSFLCEFQPWGLKSLIYLQHNGGLGSSNS